MARNTPVRERRRAITASGDSVADLLGSGRHFHRKIRQSPRRGPSRANRAQQYAGNVFLGSSHGEELFRRPHKPFVSIAGAEALFEQRFQHAGRAIWVIPDEVLGVELRPVFFKNTVTGIEFTPHFRLRMRRDDGNLRGVELQRGQCPQIFGDRSWRLRRQSDYVLALGVEAGAVESLGKFSSRRVPSFCPTASSL